MKIIKVFKIIRFTKEYPDSAKDLKHFREIVNNSNWTTPIEVIKTFKDADKVKEQWVFNICHNKYRLIAKVWFKNQKVLIQYILTHKEYDKGAWKR